MQLLIWTLLQFIPLIVSQIQQGNEGHISPLLRLHQRFNQLKSRDSSQVDEITEYSVDDAIKNVKTNTFYKKTPESNSVLNSLFEINVEEINQKSVQSHPKPQMLPTTNYFDDLSSQMINLYREPNYDLSNNSTHLLHFLDNVRSDAWGEFKKMILQYSDFIDNYYNVLSPDEKIPINVIKKLLDLGDRVNFVRILGKKVDPNLVNFLLDKLQPLIKDIPYLDKLEQLFKGNNSMSSPISSIIKSSALKTLQQFAQYILRSATPTVTEKEIMDYYHDLKITNPISASGLKLILELKDVEESNREDRSYNDPYGSYYDRSDRYLANTRSDTTYSNLKLDPYLLLAGIGAAALLTFIAYRIIVTTAARKKRDLDLGLEESDVPMILTYVYNLIEDGEDKYSSSTASESLISSVNSMWTQSLKEDGCVRCELFNYFDNGMSANKDYLDALIGAGVAEALGSENSGQLLDDVMTQLVNGNVDFSCKRNNKTCKFE